MIILGVLGRARAGKSSVAESIVESAKEKNLSVKSYEISKYVLDEMISKGFFPKLTTRKDLTEVGLKTMVCYGLNQRDRNPSYWINKVLEDLEKEQPQVALLPNIRFRNEGNAVKNIGTPGYLIRVTSLVRDGVEYISTDRDPNDLMETEQQSIDADFFISTTRGRTKLLKLQAQALFEYILKDTYN